MEVNVHNIIRKDMYCCYMMEKMVAEALSRYADMIKRRCIHVSAILYAIAQESKKHAEILEYLAQLFDLFEETNCEQLVGEPWTRIKELLNRLSIGEEIDLKSFIETQRWIEVAVGEETYHKILLPLLMEYMRMIYTDGEVAEILKRIFSKIINDEKWHEESLMKLADYKC